jgi:small membrane protein
MTIFQTLILVAILVIITKAIIRLYRKEITVWLFLLWLVVWLGVGIIDVFPNTITYIALFVGVGRGVDLVIYIALLTLLYVVFKYSIRLQVLERKISSLVRKLAIKKSLEKHSKKNNI